MDRPQGGHNVCRDDTCLTCSVGVVMTPSLASLAKYPFHGAWSVQIACMPDTSKVTGWPAMTQEL